MPRLLILNRPCCFIPISQCLPANNFLNVLNFLCQGGAYRAQTTEAQGPRTGEAEDREEEGEEGDPDPRTDNGFLHRVLAALLLHVHTQAEAADTGNRFLHGLLAGLHELRPQPGHIHDLQQGLQEGFQAHTVQVMFGLRVLLRVRKPTNTHRAVP